jgi:hypothetical protein
MEIIKEKLNKRESKMNLYEKKFNLFKNNITLSENKSMNYLMNPNINYRYDDYLKNHIVKNYNKNNDYKILRYELEEYEFNNIEINNIKQLQNKIKYLLNRYSFIVNDIIEDKWILYEKTNQNKYELEDSQFAFDNSISISNKNDEDFIFFIKNILSICKLLSKKIGYKMHTKFYDDEYHNICWLIFIFSERKKEE